MALADRIEQITRDFVAVKSVNGSPHGEKDAADFLERTLRTIPYFAAHPECVIRQELRGDKLGRANIFAYLTGTLRPSPRTIIWHGHMDTVGTEDYGALEPYAADPDALCEAMLRLDLPAEMRAELTSGDWLVGRGACDMKSGGAVFIALLEYLSTRRETFAGNILLSLNPVEENEHTGMIQGLEVLQRLAEAQGWQYSFAINNDYTCPLYADDPHRYIYTGAVGKLLPCVYVQGRETHVGQCFEGFDASVAVAEIVRAINYNTRFCDNYGGEYTLPPSVLKMQDLKTHYNVQTAKEAYCYFNFFVHAKPTATILREFCDVVSQALALVAARIRHESELYAELMGQEAAPALPQPEVLTYAELVARVAKHTGETVAAVEAAALAQARELQAVGTDKRACALAVVRMLVQKLGVQAPLAVVFFAAPYCPYNTLRQEVPEEAALYNKLTAMVQAFAAETGEQYEVKQFFPSLSDSSYLKINDDAASVAVLQDNMPAMAELYPLPLATMQTLNIPALNFGVYGKDAHKWSERVYKPYSFHTLPQLILRAVQTFLT